MTTITREQAQKIIDAADEVITALAGTNDDVHPDNSTKMVRLYDDLNDHYAPPEVVRELARIALVSLTAEPVAWRLVDSPESSVTVTDNEKMAAIWKRNGRNVQPLYSTAHGSADAVGMVVSEGRQPSAHNPESRIFEALVESGYEPVPGDKLYAAPPASEHVQIRREHAEWSDKTFGDVGPIGPLKHLSKEALEAAADPSDPLEWADMQFLLWDAQRRAGITDEQITQAMVEKLAVNKQREWPEPKDGEPRLHIKEQPAPVVPKEVHSSVIAEQLAHVLSSLDVNDHQRAIITCSVDRLNKNAEMLQQAPTSQQAPEKLDYQGAKELFNYLMTEEETNATVNGWNACRATMLQGKYRDLSQPVDPQISEYEKIMLRAGWVMVPVEPTDEMIAAALDSHLIVFNPVKTYSVMLAAAPQPETSDGKRY